MGIMGRIICCLPIVFAALDEPSNAISISLFSWMASADATQCFSHAERPARGLDDVTDLARALPLPVPPPQDSVTEILLRASPVTSDAKPFSHDPNFIPLLC
jgi:hypothetical protein